MKWVLLVVFVLSLAVGMGCSSKPRSYWPDGVIGVLDRYHGQYLTGDVGQARQALDQSIALLLSVDVRAHGRAHGLWLGYSRLFVLEQFSGRAEEATTCFAAAKSWYRLRLEVRGNSSHDVKAALDEFTPTYCLDLIRRFDAARTEERGPHCLNDASVAPAAQP